jgi:hypothetical protein
MGLAFKTCFFNFSNGDSQVWIAEPSGPEYDHARLN